MKRIPIKIELAPVESEWPKIGLLLAVVTIFAFNLVGIIQVGFEPAFWTEFNTEVFLDPDGTPALPGTLRSPEFIVLFIAAFVLAFLLPLLSPIAASAVVAIAAAPIVYLGLTIPVNESEIPFQYSLLVLLMLFGMNVLFTYFSETHEKQKLISIFGRYVPPNVVDKITRNPQLADLEGELRHLTILFCDLHDFTGLSEKLSPKTLVSLLNEYFTVMSEILYKHGATIDKYIGDSVMAFWGAPIPQEDHARRAVAAAMEMQQAMAELSGNDILAENELPLPDAMGIGINSGRVNVGNMGSRYRVSYTAIGEAVNVASRLERLTRVYQVPTIVGESTVRQIGDFAFRELDSVAVRGSHKKVRIYQPLGPKDLLSRASRDSLEHHREALAHYYSGNMTEATNRFKALADKSAQPGYYKYMLEKMNQPQTPDIFDDANTGLYPSQ